MTTITWSYKDVVNIQMRDAFEDRFADNRSFLLSETERDELLQYLESMEAKEKQLGSYLYYCLDLLNANGDVLESYYVDRGYTIQAVNGGSYWRRGPFSDYLRELEEKYGYEADLHHRQPGKNYFQLLDWVKSGYLYELTENNMVEGINLNLNDKDLEQIIAALKQSVSFGDETDQVPRRYVLELYSEGGAIMYRFHFDADGNCCCRERYEMECPGLQEWFKQAVQAGS